MSVSRALIALVLMALPMAIHAQLGAVEPQEEEATLGLELTMGPVFVVPVDGTIDLVLSRYVDRAIADAENAEASAILFKIDTFGGLVDAADRIRTALLHTDIPTVAFIDPNAASAGALISFAADRIVMAPGASMGAATAVDGTGQYASEKVQSYMRGLMRSTAEATGRDPRIAEAMVDESIEIPDIIEEGKLLTLSAREALALGVADLVLNTEAQVLSAMGVTTQEVVQHNTTTAERVLRFFGSPVMASLLMIMMLGGLYAEIRTPGIGVAGMVAAMGAAMFFAPHYLLGMVHGWEIALFFLGVMLILAEVFVIPGFGVAGISGAILVIFSLGASLIGNIGFAFPDGGEVTRAIVTLAVTLVIFVALMFSLGGYLPRSKHVNQLILAPELSTATGYTSAESVEDLIGQRGTALTALRPAGTAEVGGEPVDVVTQGTFIPAGEAIEVISVRGSRVVVRPARDVVGTSSGVA